MDQRLLKAPAFCSRPAAMPDKFAFRLMMMIKVPARTKFPATKITTMAVIPNPPMNQMAVIPNPPMNQMTAFIHQASTIQVRQLAHLQVR